MNQATPAASVGLIGLGLMGMACAKRMRAAGLELLGYDIDAPKIAAVVKLTDLVPRLRIVIRK